MNPADFVLGLDFGGTKIALATAGAEGDLLQRQDLPTLAERGANQAVARAIAAGQALVERTRAERGGTLVGVGVATMGVTLTDRVLMAPNVPGWDRLALPGTMRQAFPSIPVRIDNDVKAAATAELRWGALVGIQVGVYLNLGTGIAAALMADGHVLGGAHGAAGEIGYDLRTPSDAVGAREGHAPLEEAVGGKAFADRARALLGPTAMARDLFEADGTNPEIGAYVERVLAEIAFHVVNLAIALDPSRVVVGGGLMRAKAVVLPHLQRAVERSVPIPAEVVEAHFTLDATLMGAIALALEAG